MFKKKKYPKREIFFLIVLEIIFLVLMLKDINSWYYSVIGDEYPFFNYAAYGFDIPLGFRIFSQAGVYGYHPVLSSYYQHLIMSIFGFTNFGWRLSSILIIGFSIPLVYLLIKLLFGKSAAFVGSTIFSFSSYFWAYAHTGYNNIQSILPYLISLVLIIQAEKKNNFVLYVLAGAVSGLGWYTFYTSRVTILIILTYILLSKIRRIKHFLNCLYPLIAVCAGFLLTTLPLFIVNKWDVFIQMRYQSVLNRQWLGTYVDNQLLRWVNNFTINFFSFITGSNVKHFLAGPLLDKVDALFVLVGIAVILRNIAKPNYLFVAISFLINLATVAFNPIKEIAISRMQLVVLYFVLIAAIGFAFLINKFSTRFKILGRFLLLFFVIVILVLNYFNFYHVIPQKFPVTSDSLIVKAVQESTSPVVDYEGVSENSAFRTMIRAYGLESKITFINDNSAKRLPPTYLLVNNSKSTDSNFEQELRKCKRFREIVIKDYTKTNHIKGFYCY